MLGGLPKAMRHATFCVAPSLYSLVSNLQRHVFYGANVSLLQRNALHCAGSPISLTPFSPLLPRNTD